MRRKLTPQQITVMANWPRLIAQRVSGLPSFHPGAQGWFLDGKNVAGTVHTLIKRGWLRYNWPKTGNGLKLNPKMAVDDNITSEA
jgi:hypothetical protein